MDSNLISERVQSLAERFIELGIDLAIGIPGTGPVLDFLSRFEERGGKFILCKNEATAPIIAGTIGRRENKPMLAVCANGTARINLLSGITHCWFENLPVINLWDSYSLSTPEYQRLQRLPKHDFHPFFNVLLDGLGEDYQEIGKFLFNNALEPNYGPVGVNLRITDNTIPSLGKDNSHIKSTDRFDNVISDKKYIKPVMIFGARSTVGKTGEEIRQEFDNLRIPKLTTIGAKGLFSEKDEFNLRVFTGVGGSYTPESMILEEADVVIGVNLRHSDVIKVGPFDQTTLLFDLDRLDESYGFGGKQFLINKVSKLKQMILEITNTTWTNNNCRDIHTRSNKQILSKDNQAGRLIHEVSKTLLGSATVVVDDGIYQKHSEYLWLTEHYQNYISTGVGRNMGSALPAALGLALRYPDENVVCLTGDAGLPLFLGELSLLCDHDHGKLLVIHFADFALGSMKTRKLDNLDKLVGTSVSYYEVFRIFGFKSIKTDSVSDAVKSVDEWRVNRKNLFLEFRLNTKKYPMTFNLIRQKTK